MIHAVKNNSRFLLRVSSACVYSFGVDKLERFFSRVVKGPEPSDCWQWQGKLSQGYGRYGGTNAHRWYFIQINGQPPRGYHIDHLCRNRACVNPAHLEAVTPLENVRRGLPFRKLKSNTICRYGHDKIPHPVIRQKWNYCWLCKKLGGWLNYGARRDMFMFDAETMELCNRNIEKYVSTKLAQSPNYSDFVIYDWKNGTLKPSDNHKFQESVS